MSPKRTKNKKSVNSQLSESGNEQNAPLRKAKGSQKAKLQETNKMKGEILPVLIPSTQLKVQKSATHRKLWAGLIYKFYNKYHSIKIFIQTEMNIVTNNVKFNNGNNFDNLAKSPASKANKKIKKINFTIFTQKTTNFNIADYESNLVKMGEFLSGYNLNKNTVCVQPRGLINRSTRCYINATLQALLACPPFFNLMKTVKINFTDIMDTQNNPKKSKIPIIESIAKFIGEFEFQDNTLMGLQGPLKKGISLEPNYVYKLLPTFEDGYQEDAEEFMCHLFNGINDEMIELIKMIKTNEDDKTKPVEIEWNNVKHNHDLKSTVIIMEKTPLSKIFRGNFRTRIILSTNELNDKFEPFFTIKLDIENAKSVIEALRIFNTNTILEDFNHEQSNIDVTASQQISIGELPYVLILHIKCFTYKDNKLSKILKDFEFDVNLKIEPYLISKKSKKNMRRSNYRLFAVIWHDGKEATNGHYFADVFYTNLNRWLRFDDSAVRCVTEDQVLHPRHLVMPYLLYYIKNETAPPDTKCALKRARRTC